MVGPNSSPFAKATLWIGASAIAEAIGMSAAASAAGLFGAAAGAPLATRLIEYVAALVAGGIEAGAVGLLQGLAIKQVLPALPLVVFALAFTVLGIAGWAIGQLPPLLFGGAAASVTAEPAPILILGYLVAFGAIGGLAIGAVQGWFLKRLGQPIARWIVLSSVGWALGFLVTGIGATSVDEHWSLAAKASAGIVTGLVAGSLVGIATLPAYLRLRSRSD